jgi:hypothetical protein
LGQFEPNFGGMVLGWPPSKIVSSDHDFQPRWRKIYVEDPSKNYQHYKCTAYENVYTTVVIFVKFLDRRKI